MRSCPSFRFPKHDKVLAPLFESHLLTQLASNFKSLQWLSLTFFHVELHAEEKDREKVRANPNVGFAYLLDLNLELS